MLEEDVKKENTSTSSEQTTALALSNDALNKESHEIINNIISETNREKTKDLTYLFNQNQKKKAMVRLDKISALQDILVDQAIDRFTKKPDEIDNNTLVQALKTTQDMVERNNKMILDQADTPLIQINQQTNELNVNGVESLQTKESRDRVKNAVASILANLTNVQNQQNVEEENTEIINAELIEDEENTND